MPQSPARTESFWCPKGYFNKKEQKIIVNSGEPIKPHEQRPHSNPLQLFETTLRKAACITDRVYQSDKSGSAPKTTTCGLCMLSACSLDCLSTLSINTLHYPSVVWASMSSNPICYRSRTLLDLVSQCWPSQPSVSLSITEASCLWRRMHGYFRASWH